MLRCAFAHDPMEPRWQVKLKYRRVFDVPLAKLRVDCSNVDGTNLTPEQLDHWGGLLRLLGHAQEIAQVSHNLAGTVL